MSSSPKVVVQAFENYAKSQLTFVHSVAELAAKPSYAECLRENQAVDIVMPLAISANPTVRINAVLALTRLIGHSEPCSKQVLCSKNLLYQLLYGQIVRENKYYKKNCMSLVKNLCKHSLTNAEIVIKECGGIEAILICLKDFDAFVREAALQAISVIVRHDANLAQFIVNSGALPAIVLCLKEKQQNLKHYALIALDDIAKHNEDLAQSVVDVSTLTHIFNFLSTNSTDVKIQICSLELVKDIVKHSLFLTESAIEFNVLPSILLLMAHPDESIRNSSAKVIRDVVKHSVQIAQLIVNAGGIASLLNVISCSKEFPVIPAILSLGYIAGMSPILASAILQSDALLNFMVILKNDKENLTKASVVWTLGMIGQHSPEHSRLTCVAVPDIIEYFKDPCLDNDSQYKCRIALRQILNECDDYDVLDKLLIPSTPLEIITYILEKISKILPKNAKARRSFIINGHLKMIQNLKPEIDSDLFKIIKTINCCFPEDIIQMVAGDFPETVMKAVDKFVPKNQCLFYNRQLKSDEKLSKSNLPRNKTLFGEEFE